MLRFLLLALFLSTLGFSQSAHATDNIVVCGNDNWMDFDGARMDALQDKANNLANFGPAGTYGDYSWTFVEIGPIPTTAALNANACQVWLSGYDNDADYTDLVAFTANGGFVIGACDNVSFDAVCGGLGYSLTNIGNQPGGYTVTDPPNYLTCDGLVNNAALTLTVAGGASTYFSAGIALGVYDSNGERLVITDSLTAPTLILTGDSELYTTFGTSAVTDGPLVTSDQDKFVVNSLKTAADTVTGAVALNGLPACEDISEILVADLSISKDDGQVTAGVGSSLNYTIEVVNAGPESSGTGVTLVDVLPVNITVNNGAAGGVTLGGTDAADWTCSSDNASPQQIDCSYVGGGSGIPSNGSSEIIITTDPIPAVLENTNVTNNVEVIKGVGYGETDFTNNTASDSTLIDSSCVFGAGIADPSITAYVSDEAFLNNATTRAAADTLDDAWRAAVGQPVDGVMEPWLGYPAGTIVINNFEPDLFTTEGVSVDVSLVNMAPAGDCNGTLNATGSPRIYNANIMENTAPRPESLYTVGNQPGFWRDLGGTNTSANGMLFEFAQPVKEFGLWVADLESRTQGGGVPGYLRLLDATGNRIGQDIAIAPSNIITSAGTSAVDQNDCGTIAPGIDQGCGNRSTRWVGFVDNAAAARVHGVLYTVGDDDNNGNAFAERLGFIGADVARDYSDAPASYGTPSHYLINDTRLLLGSVDPDAETAAIPTVNADGDDLNIGSDDEDAISGALPALSVSASSYSIAVDVNNSTTNPATLVAWIDFDGDNAFQNDEGITVVVAAGTTPTTPVVLNWPAIPAGTVVGQSYLRLRLSSDPDLDQDAMDGLMIDGEVEDYPITITNAQVDLTIVKSVDVPEAAVGQTITFTLRVNNVGTGDATSVQVTDIVPGGFTYVAGSMTGGNSQDQSSPNGTGLIWTINAFASGGPEVVLTFQAVVNSP